MAMADAALGAERQAITRTSRYRLERQFSNAQETIAMAAIYAANHYANVRGIACLTESGTTPLLMSRLSSGLPIFALSHHSQTLQKLCLCRGVIPLFFDATASDNDSVEARAIEFLLDGGYLQKSDSILLTEAAVRGQGVALGRSGLVGDHLASGRLVRALAASRPADYAYWAVTTHAGEQNPRIRVFIDWMEQEVEREARAGGGA